MQEPNLPINNAEKHKAILDHALQVFAKEGYRNTDVGVIADLAGVGKGTVYRYFGNKEKLFLATSEYCAKQLGAALGNVVGINEDGNVDMKDTSSKKVLKSEGTLSILRAIAIAYAKFYELNPEAIEIMIQERAEFRDSVVPSHLMYRAEQRKRMDNFLQAAIDRGEIRDVDVDNATNAFADLLFGSVINGCLEGGKLNLVARVESAIDLYLNGLAPSSN